MDTTTFDTVARLFGTGMTRREALRGLMAGAAAVTTGGALLQGEDASADGDAGAITRTTSVTARTGASTGARRVDRPGDTASAW
jgi:hypothetical protein